MADRSRRTGSRRNTPQPATERRGRATRSRSHDISDIEDTSDTRQAQPRSAHTLKPTKAGLKAKASNAKTVDSRDLSIVTEEPSHTSTKRQQRKSEINDQRLAEAAGIADRKSLGGASAFSGTTARTSNSASELDDLRAETVTDAISEIAPEADKLVDLLVSGERWDSGDHEVQVQRFLEELDSKTSRAPTQLKRLSPKFFASLDYFDTSTFVDIPAVLRALFGSSLPPATVHDVWRPDSLLQKVNIASFALVLFSPKDTPNDKESWKTIDRDFPKPFFDEKEDLNDDARHSILGLAIEIRTQYFMKLVAEAFNDGTISISDVLDRVFTEAGSFKGWSFSPLQSQELDEQSINAIQTRVEAIRKIIARVEKVTADRTRILQKLDQQYAWNAFLSSVGQWLKTRADQADNILEGQGGSAKTVKALEREMTRHRREQLQNQGSMPNRDDAPKNDRQTSPVLSLSGDRQAVLDDEQRPEKPRVKELKSVAFNPLSPKDKAKVAAVLARTQKARRSVNNTATASKTQNEDTPNAESSLQAQQRAASVEFQPLAGELDLDQADGQADRASNNDADVHRLSEAAIQDIVHLNVSQLAESNKENEGHRVLQQSRRSQFRYNVAQPDARREVFNDADSDGPPLRDVTPHQNRRRSDARSTNRKRPSPEVESAHQSPAKRPRVAGTQRERNRSSQVAPEGLAEVTSGEVYREANLAAKARVASRGKAAQSRVPWSEEESGRLIDLIEQYGCGWSMLKEIDRVHPDGCLLANRDQVALKDKANNMKVDYLKAARNLPNRNWDNVSLRSNMIAKLRDLGILYDKETGRREDADL